MKLRVFALILSLSLLGWAQETPATSTTPNSTPAPKAKGCCHHAAAATKDAMSCCGNDNNKCEAKDGNSCCTGKDTKADMKECKNSDCGKNGKSCGEAKGDKTAMGCCGSKCEHQPQTPAGN